MANVPVIIRSSGDCESVLGGKLTVTLLGLAIVIAVADFERLQPCCGKPRDEMVHQGQSRMSHRYKSSGLACYSEDRFGRRPAPRHERRPADTKQPRERIVAIAGVPGGHERIGYLRPADAPAGCARQRLDVDDIPQRGKTIRYPSDPFDALRTL
jgi:hypothetical protein